MSDDRERRLYPPLDGGRLRAALDARGRADVGLLTLPVTASTNDDAGRALGASGMPRTSPPVLVMADAQSAGRGRRGRLWSAPAGSAVTMSLALGAPGAPQTRGWIPLLAAVAAADAVQDATDRRLTASGNPPRTAGSTKTPASVGVKWPNDLMVSGYGKVGGILCEAGRDGTVVLGLGINVWQNAAELPAPRPGPSGTHTLAATSLAEVLAPAAPKPAAGVREELAADIADRVLRWVDAWRAAGEDAQPAALRRGANTLAEQYLHLLQGVGRPVVISRGQPTAAAGAQNLLRGLIAGVSADGGLEVSTERGLVICHAGDVWQVRLAPPGA